jgi:HD-like signal output (HDOD) protein
VSPDEVALAALLSECGELLLWHFAPELPLKVIAELSSGRAFRPIKAQTQALGFSFKQMTLTLVEAWKLPNIIALLIKGTDTARANIARMAVDTARHIVVNNRHPALPAELVNIKAVLPEASYAKLIAPLPIPDDYKLHLLQFVEGTSSTT